MTAKPTLSHRLARALGPAVATVSPREAARAGLGALIGLGLVGMLVLAPTVDPRLGLYLIAPFGATSVLIFAVPNSPLAQPWSAVVGNTIAGLVGVAVCLTVADPALRIALAVGLAITLMSLARAVHPPAGAVAMTAAMSPDAIQQLGFRFALAPVALGTILLVLVAMVYARATGRHYPLRHFDDTNAQGTADRPAAERLGLSEEDLTRILSAYNQSLNLGAEDLARLIGAAEMRAAGHRAGPLTAEEIMSRDLVTVTPETPLSEVAELFRQHGFTSLPVVEGNDRFLGVIFQIHLIRRGREDALRIGRGFGAAMARLLDRRRETPPRAGEIMASAVPRATLMTPLGALLPMLAEGNTDAIPVLERERLVGIVTRTDIIAAMARETARRMSFVHRS
ncbi:HPP family protein [Amaricoccus solimangrovi]|uniref:CBS domain-containing protein n=1 Tax=Amaricoccus solimangrovi TaxID=2589815 RepID=A0A501WK27_9RHOB|nr:HPP family protein [Amaricoccus solimangrovi]TPE49698.1 CBS domain-containing protein [Amaricoccus solimangrovi]